MSTALPWAVFAFLDTAHCIASMQFSHSLITRYIEYMKRKHAVDISSEQAEDDLTRLAEFHHSFLQGGRSERVRRPTDRS